MKVELREVPVLYKPELDPLTYLEWGSDISFEQWQYREQALCSVKWVRERMRAWKHVNELGQVIATCETFQMIHRDGGHVYGIASVVTPKNLRGRGNAGRLLTQVMKKIEGEDPLCRGWILYSEVDPKVYERVGFRAVKDHDWILPPLLNERLRLSSMGATKWISHPEVVRDFMASRSSLIQITGDQLDWHFTRENVYREFLKPSHFNLDLHAGAEVSGQGGILWSVNYRENYLQVLAMETDAGLEMLERKKAAASLLTAAQHYAATLNLGHVCLWNTEDESVSSSCPVESARPMPRPDTIPMIRGIEAEKWAPCSRSSWC